MLFMQPVVVNDASAADRSPPPAEVRIVERRAPEPLRWTGTTLAQGALDQRSPFGANAPNANDGTPAPRMMNPNDSTQPGGAPAQVADPMSTTKIPPPQGMPDAGPPPPAGTQGAPVNPTTPSAANQAATPSATTPGVPPGTHAPAGQPPGATVPGSNAPAPVPTPAPPAPPARSTLPGVSSGASNTR